MSSLLNSKTNWIVIGGVLVMTYLLISRWNTQSQLELHQTALIAGIEDNRWGPCKKRISQNYEDRWGWKRDDLKLVFQDIRSQFLVLGLHLEDTRWNVTNNKATLTARIRVGGTPFGIGSSIQSMINRESSPMIFNWEKESWQPWSWKLVSMNHPEIDMDGYEPGDLVKATKF